MAAITSSTSPIPLPPVSRLVAVPDPESDTRPVIPLTAPENAPPPPLTNRNVQAQPAVNPDVARIAMTKIGLQLGDNRMIPIELSKEKSDRYQASLDAAGQALKEQIIGYLYETDKAKGSRDENLVTWYRYDPQTRSIVYQINNKADEHHISFKQIQKQGNPKPFLEAMAKFDTAISDIQGYTVRFVEHADSHVTLMNGPNPFDKSTHPALKQLNGKSFEEALDEVNRRLAKSPIRPNPNVAKNFEDLKEVLRNNLADVKQGSEAALVKLFEALLQDIDAMDGFAVGLAAALTIAPKDYDAAEKLREHIRGIVPANQYIADIFGLYLQSHWDEDEGARLQSMYSEVALSLHASKAQASTEHGLLSYLITRDVNKLSAFLSQRFASVGTQFGDPAAVLIQEICDELNPGGPPLSRPVDEDEDDLP